MKDIEIVKFVVRTEGETGFAYLVGVDALGREYTWNESVYIGGENHDVETGITRTCGNCSEFWGEDTSGQFVDKCKNCGC